jgi:phosphohistidine phosphatase
VTAHRFYLVRHGRAEGKHPAGDAARRLTADGRARFAAHARALAPEVRPSSVVTSPFARARETAELLGAATGAPVVEDPALASGASSGGEILALGRRLGGGVALVGHNPELAEAVALAAGGPRELEPGAVAAIDTDGGGYRLAWLRAPA